MKTIDEVIACMDEIVTQCMAQNHPAGYFAVLYRHVTSRIKQGIENREFEDNERMEQLDIIFAQRYFDAWEAWSADEPASLSWERAFDATSTNEHLVMQHLLMGINAHINLDLGIAAAETMHGKPINGIKKDFDMINEILASLVDRVKSNINKVSPVFGILTSLARGKDELLLNFSIKVARDGAWKFANVYFQSTDKVTSFTHRDIAIARLADGIARPGKWPGLLVKIVRWGEWGAVSAKMKILADV